VVDHGEAGNDLPEQRVLGGQAGVGAGDDEELAARRPGGEVFAMATTPWTYLVPEGGASTVV
jgi:hypothetical protein